jgi:hypothetical protein
MMFILNILMGYLLRNNGGYIYDENAKIPITPQRVVKTPHVMQIHVVDAASSIGSSPSSLIFI